MSKHPTKTDIKKIQFVVKEETSDWDNLKIIEKTFPYPKRSDSIKMAMSYLVNLLGLAKAKNIEELNSRLKIVPLEI